MAFGKSARRQQSLVRVGLDVHVLTGPHQGTTSVWLNLLSELPATCEYVLYSFDPGGLARRFPGEHFIHRRIPPIPAAVRIQLAFPMMTRRDRCDVLHMNYYGPLGGGPPLVLHVHDVIYLDFPQYSTGLRRGMFATLGRASAGKAARVITVSEYAKGRIASRYGLSEDRITVISPGLDRSWLQPSEPKIEEAWSRLKSRVPQRFALSVGRLDPRKNFAATARVARSLVEQGKLDGLVLVGPDDFGSSQLRSELERDSTSPFVTHLSALNTASLQALYRNASCLLYLSAAEGFGLPLIEAMAMGTPIVASNRTSIPEVVGDAGLIVDPSDESDATRAAAKLLDDSRLRDTIVSRGSERVRRFSGSDSASKLVEVYETVAQRRE